VLYDERKLLTFKLPCFLNATLLVAIYRRELNREKTWSRIHLVPLLQAESDRAEARTLDQQEELERRVMKDVPDWETRRKVYNTERFVPPSVIVADEKWLNLY
jgi:NADH dehydrogenase (ubiquinone) 1 alpha subcomplex subunit 13